MRAKHTLTYTYTCTYAKTAGIFTKVAAENEIFYKRVTLKELVKYA